MFTVFLPNSVHCVATGQEANFTAMRREKIPPYLTTVLGKKRCSACGMVFPKDSKPSLSKAFAEHVRSVHKPKKTED